MDVIVRAIIFFQHNPLYTENPSITENGTRPFSFRYRGVLLYTESIFYVYTISVCVYKILILLLTCCLIALMTICLRFTAFFNTLTRTSGDMFLISYRIFSLMASRV